LTNNISEIVRSLEGLRAEGGGDYPESVNEALHVALHDIHWDTKQTTIKLIFLIGDAPPHLDYANDYAYEDEINIAQNQWITVHAVGCSGLNKEGEDIFKEIALQTEGEFEFLAYTSRYVDAEGDTVTVVTEGSITTYTKGDSSWTGGAYGYDGLRGGELVYAPGVDDAAGYGGEGAKSIGSAENNLSDLITNAIKRAAEERGVEYETPTSVMDDLQPEGNVSNTSWGQLKEEQGEW
jgi:hypothetical protein